MDTQTQRLLTLRTRWLAAAKVYYLGAGEDSGMSDHEWDAIGRELFASRDKLPLCPVLHDERYQGGSLFWVNRDLYQKAAEVDPAAPRLTDICGTPFAVGDYVATDVCSYKTSYLRVGKATEFDGKYVKVTYETGDTRKDGKPCTRSVTRRPSGVVKVDRPEVTNG